MCRELTKFLVVGGVAFFAGVTAGTVYAAEETAPSQTRIAKEDSIEVIRIVGRQPVTATSVQTVPSEDFELRPLESGGEMLEAIPNLLTGQHTGGGKAEQYFIRGFDADHGTDLAVYFDGVPVNLPSHAHGQGFLDLHFITPETIDLLNAYKGTYFTRYGDFATAGTVEYVPQDGFQNRSSRWSTVHSTPSELLRSPLPDQVLSTRQDQPVASFPLRRTTPTDRSKTTKTSGATPAWPVAKST